MIKILNLVKSYSSNTRHVTYSTMMRQRHTRHVKYSTMMRQRHTCTPCKVLDNDAIVATQIMQSTLQRWYSRNTRQLKYSTTTPFRRTKFFCIPRMCSIKGTFIAVKQALKGKEVVLRNQTIMFFVLLQ